MGCSILLRVSGFFRSATFMNAWRSIPGDGTPEEQPGEVTRGSMRRFGEQRK